jgi:hypothetical protein
MRTQKISPEWGAAYAVWLSALAEMEKLNADVDQPEVSNEENDQRVSKMTALISDAEHRMIRTPVMIGWQLLQKFDVLRAMLHDRERAGLPADSRHMLMLASVGSDVQYLDEIGAFSAPAVDEAGSPR